MKTKLYTPALALLLLAGASGAALAQDRDHDRSQAAPQAAPHPAGPAGGGAPGGGHRDGGPQGGPHGGPQGGPQGAPGGGGQRGPGDRFSPQAHGVQAPAPGAAAPQRFDHDRGQGPGAPGGGPRQPDHERGPNVVIPPGGGDRNDNRGGDRGHDGRPDGRPDGRDGRWDGRGGPGPGPVAGGGRGPGNGGHGSPQHWQPGRYPPVFWSHDRFHAGGYRAPYGYYVRSWQFGDILPGGWFGDSYWINDFLDYDLPYPPPGYEWVRVGGDALMVDRYTGRIVQVVRGIFW